MLQLIDVKKDYKTAGAAVHALKGVTLRFRKNEFVSILGASGCGKTTMLNIIGGLDHYTSGDLIINGKSTKKYKDKDWDVYRNHRIGFVFQSYNLIPHQTVLGNVEIALTIAGVSKAERKRRAVEALKRVGLGKELKKRPNQLSGGQMQRVAIARALVNNPEILLADEPTGALDTETSVQIMDLIREIAGERLVIMVTHNPELAEEYSSRIVRLQDGLVISDTNPYDGQSEEEPVDENALYAQAITEEVERSATAGEPITNEKLDQAVANAKDPKRKKGKKERSAMSFGTSLGLSARNLAMKKGRTVITSIAGSIGIISVCLVLALSNGFNNYILKTQEDMLASNPLKISETTVDVEAIMSGMTSTNDMPDLSQLDDEVYVNSFITSMAKGMSVTNNLSEEYQNYVESMDEEFYQAICKTTGVEISDYLFTEAKLGADTDPSTPISLTTLQNTFIGMSGLNAMEMRSLYSFIAIMGDPYGTIPGTTKAAAEEGKFAEYARSQYDVVAGHFPTSANEAVLVVGENNELSDLVLAQLGLITQENFQKLISRMDMENPEMEDMRVNFSDILGKKYVLSYHDAVYTEGTTFLYDYQGVRSQLEVTDGMTITVSGIVRLKEDLNYGCLSGGLYLTEQAIDEFIAANAQSKMTNALKISMEFSALETDNERSTYVNDPQNAAKLPYLTKQINDGLATKTQSTMSGDTTPLHSSVAINGVTYYTINEAKAATLLQSLGSSDKITEIYIYTDSFNSKKQILNYLDEWNENCEDPANEVKYTDTIGMLMEMVEMMLNAITIVLVAFTAISLIVSSVMIGIITYVSVVERVKEIGVLRSLGGRKKDIKNLFNAETFIIGLSSGLFGVVVTYLLSIGINSLLGKLTGIATLAALPVSSAAIMVVISIALTLISGLIPAKAAAKKDPVVALRTE